MLFSGKSVLLAGLITITGCAVDVSRPIERTDRMEYAASDPVTHKVVCRCTCRSDNGSAESTETHALPQTGKCETLNQSQCELQDSGGYGFLENCFKKSVPVSD